MYVCTEVKWSAVYVQCTFFKVNFILTTHADYRRNISQMANKRHTHICNTNTHEYYSFYSKSECVYVYTL